MNPGDTFFGLDLRGHLWMVLTAETPEGHVAVANLTTHDPARRRLCDERCVVVRPGQHPYPEHDSCVFYRDAFMTSRELLLQGVANRTYRPGAPLAPPLLERIRQGALDSPLTATDVKIAIRREQSGRSRPSAP